MRVEARHAVPFALAAGLLFLGHRAYRLEAELEELRSSRCATDGEPADSFDRTPGPQEPLPSHPVQTPPAPTLPSATTSPDPSGRAALRSRDDVAAYWEAAFAAEPLSLSWFEKGRLFRDNMHAALPEGGAIRSFACRSTLCRTELGFRNIREYHALVDRVFAVPDSVMNEELSGFVGATSVQASDGSLVVVIFLTRRGRSMLAAQ